MENNPYSPSPSSLKGASRLGPEDAAAGFRDLSRISSRLSLLLLIGAGWELLSLLSSLLQLNFLSQAQHTTAEASGNDLREALTGVVQLILYIVTAIVFGRWIYRAHKNLPELGARYLRITPGWAVGSFFVPLLNLWVPYQAMRDLAKASSLPRRWELEATSPPILIWWILWVIVQFLGNATLRMQTQAHSLEELQAATSLDIVSEVLSVPLYFLARHIVWRVWCDQEENYRQMRNVVAA
jgi:hypothetical protein